MAEKKDTNKKPKVKKKTKPVVYVPSLRSMYKDEIVPAMLKLFKYSNIMEVPKLKNISLNMGLGDAKNNSKDLESALDEITLISGQKPIVTKAKKDISNFKIRKGWPVGCKVTLRSDTVSYTHLPLPTILLV